MLLQLAGVAGMTDVLFDVDVLYRRRTHAVQAVGVGVYVVFA